MPVRKVFKAFGDENHAKLKAKNGITIGQPFKYEDPKAKRSTSYYARVQFGAHIETVALTLLQPLPEPSHEQH